MFTGLIEELGQVAEVSPKDGGKLITVSAHRILSTLSIGDSMAVDGTCTTLIALHHDRFTFEASPETLRKTTLDKLSPGDKVNLERPLMPNGRLGGHFVSGHVDGRAQLVWRHTEGNAVLMGFQPEQVRLMEHIIEKGSVTISGVSLTVNDVSKNQFSVAIIPHTLNHTNFSELTPGDWVNLETDMIGKYVQKLISGQSTSVVPVGRSNLMSPPPPLVNYQRHAPYRMPSANPLNDLVDDEAVFIDASGFLVAHQTA